MIGPACNWPGDSPCNRPECSNCAPTWCAWDCYRAATTERDGRPTCAKCAREHDAARAEDLYEKPERVVL